MRRSIPAPVLTLSAFVLSATAMGYISRANAATAQVSNCNDSGAGSLRTVIHSARSGDTIDLRSLGCTRIALSRGILVSQDDLSIVGRGASVQTIDGNHVTRVFAHNGRGTLLIRSLAIANGREVGDMAIGGCIRSAGNVELQHAVVHHCVAETDGFRWPAFARGGGISADGNVRLSQSGVFSNAAVAIGTFNAHGGGIFAAGSVSLSDSAVSSNSAVAQGGLALAGGMTAARLSMFRSRINGNKASVDPDGGTYSNSTDGGALVDQSITAAYSVIANNSANTRPGVRVQRGSITLHNSTVANNRGRYGAAIQIDDPAGSDSVIYNSTISGNIGGASSAILTNGALWLANNTIVFNRGTGLHWDEDPELGPCEGAVYAYDVLFSYSNIIAMNSCDSAPSQDVYAGVIDGSNNLIGSSMQPLPADTISANPLLAPLADNGGPTPTRALLEGSPALDRGNNVMGLVYDQRGPGYPREKGSEVDIGAFER